MRVLMLAHAGTNSRDILLDVEAGFRQAGHEVIRWEFEPMQRLVSRVGAGQGRAVLTADMGEIVRNLIEANKIDFSLAMWANGLMAFGVTPAKPGEPASSFFERIRSPHVLFWLDAPHWAHQGGVAPLFRSPVVAEHRLVHVINNCGLAREMREVLGFGRVLGRRYGINPEVFRPWPGVEPKHDIVFNLGPGDPEPTDLMRRELESDEPDTRAIREEAAGEARRKALAAVSDAREIADREAMAGLVEALVASQLGSPSIPVLDRLEGIARDEPGLAPGLAVLRANPKLFVRVAEAVRSVESWRRAFTITYLSRHFDCAVFGADGLAGWPHRARQYGPAPYRELSKMYAMGRIGLNTMRWQDDVGLNIKPFEITASGRACLCEGRAGLEELFEIGTEIAAFGTPGEARRAAGELLGSPERLKAMAEAGRARTLRDHTWARWAEDVCAAVAGG